MAVHASGLADLAYRKEPDAPWPTLGELIRGGTPLVVFSQREGGYPDGFLPAFSLMQDNPYSARTIEELSCASNRGPLTADLFLMNHWINTDPRPLPSHAASVNRAEVLIARARECERVRGKLPNLIGVDFEDVGELYDAVARLNRAPLPPR